MLKRHQCAKKMRLSIKLFAVAWVLTTIILFLNSWMTGLIGLFIIILPMGYFFWRSGTYISPQGLKCISVNGKKEFYAWDRISFFSRGNHKEEYGGYVYGIIMHLENPNSTVLLPMSGLRFHKKAINKLYEEIVEVANLMSPDEKKFATNSAIQK